MVKQLDKQFADLESIQSRRNLLAHGLWMRGASEKTYKVQPLNLKKGLKSLEDAVDVNMEYLHQILRDIENLNNDMGWMGAEMLAHQQLKAWGKA